MSDSGYDYIFDVHFKMDVHHNLSKQDAIADDGRCLVQSLVSKRFMNLPYPTIHGELVCGTSAPVVTGDGALVVALISVRTPMSL